LWIKPKRKDKLCHFYFGIIVTYLSSKHSSVGLLTTNKLRRSPAIPAQRAPKKPTGVREPVRDLFEICQD